MPSSFPCLPNPPPLLPFSFSWTHTLHKSQAPKGLSVTASRGPNLRLTTSIRLAAIHSTESDSLSEIRKLSSTCIRLFCDPVDCGLPGSSVHGILQAIHWSGLLFLFPGVLPSPGVSLCLLFGRWILYHLATRELERLVSKVCYLLCHFGDDIYSSAPLCVK